MWPPIHFYCWGYFLQLIGSLSFTICWNKILKEHSLNMFVNVQKAKLLIHVRKNEDKGLVCWVLHYQNRPAYLLTVNKYDNEKLQNVASWNDLTLLITMFVFNQKNISRKHRCIEIRMQLQKRYEHNVSSFIFNQSFILRKCILQEATSSEIGFNWICSGKITKPYIWLIF